MENVITIANAALWLMVICVMVAPWLGGTARFVLLTIGSVLFAALVLWAPATLVNAVGWLATYWWVLILIIVAFGLGIVLKRNSN